MQIEVRDYRKTLGERVSETLRQRYGAHAAKQAARITGADLRTAQGWISEGREPRGAALLAIIRETGRDGLLALFGPELETHDQKLEREIHELREEAARLEARLGTGRAAAPHLGAEGKARPAPAQRIDHNRVRRGPARPGQDDE